MPSPITQFPVLVPLREPEYFLLGSSASSQARRTPRLSSHQGNNDYFRQTMSRTKKRLDFQSTAAGVADSDSGMRSWLPLFSAVVGLVLTSCSRHPDVVVTDHTGMPVAGAKVEAVTPSLNYAPTLTDAKGHASLPSTAQKIETLNITAPGSATKVTVRYNGAKPHRVSLAP